MFVKYVCARQMAGLWEVVERRKLRVQVRIFIFVRLLFYQQEDKAAEIYMSIFAVKSLTFVVVMSLFKGKIAH